SKARPARAKRRVSPKPAASRDGGAHASRSCPQGHSLAVATGGPCREPIDSWTVTLSVEGGCSAEIGGRLDVMTGASGGADPGARPGWRWDIALSFAGAQRDYVEQVAQALRVWGLR